MREAKYRNSKGEEKTKEINDQAEPDSQLG